jgi:hypothetical protein
VRSSQDIEVHFGTDKALAYLIGEKFLNLLEAAEDDAEFRGEIPAFVAEIKRIFERWQFGGVSGNRTAKRAVRPRDLRRSRGRRDGKQGQSSPQCLGAGAGGKGERMAAGGVIGSAFGHPKHKNASPWRTREKYWEWSSDEPMPAGGCGLHG